MIISALLLLATFLIGVFVLTHNLQKAQKDDKEPSSSVNTISIEPILKEIRELREDIVRKEKALIDLLQELKEEE